MNTRDSSFILHLSSFAPPPGPTTEEQMADTPKRITVPVIRAMKGEKRIGMITAYDYPSAKVADAAGSDIILVGDSLGMVVLGYPDTLSVTVDDMLHHTRAAARGAAHALVVGDMPYLCLLYTSPSPRDGLL